MTRKSIKECYRAAASHIERIAGNYYRAILYYEVKKIRPKLPPPFDLCVLIDNIPPERPRFVPASLASFCHNLLAYMIGFDGNATHDEVQCRFSGIEWSIEIFRFKKFEVAYLCDEDWESMTRHLPLNEESLREILWENSEKYALNSPFVLLRDSFKRNPYQYRPKAGTVYRSDESDEEAFDSSEDDCLELESFCVLNDECQVVNIFEILDRVYDPETSKAYTASIARYADKLRKYSVELDDFGLYYQSHKRTMTDFFGQIILGNSPISNREIVLSCVDGKTGVEHDLGGFKLALSNEEIDFLRNYLNSTPEAGDDAIFSYYEFSSIRLNQSEDFSPKLLPLYKLCERTFAKVLVPWRNELKNTSMPIGVEYPVEFFEKSLNYGDASQILKNHFSRHQTRYEQLKKICLAWRLKWRNGYVHKQKMTRSDYQEAIIGCLSFYCLLILVFSHNEDYNAPEKGA